MHDTLLLVLTSALIAESTQLIYSRRMAQNRRNDGRKNGSSDADGRNTAQAGTETTGPLHWFGKHPWMISLGSLSLAGVVLIVNMYGGFPWANRLETQLWQQKMEMKADDIAKNVAAMKLELDRLQIRELAARFKVIGASKGPMPVSDARELASAASRISTSALSFDPNDLVSVSTRILGAADSPAFADPSFTRLSLRLLNLRTIAELNGRYGYYVYQHGDTAPCTVSESKTGRFQVIGPCTLLLDWGGLTAVDFEKVAIVVHGGPLVLRDIHFKNCRTIIDADRPEAQDQTLRTIAEAVKADGHIDTLSYAPRSRAQ